MGRVNIPIRLYRHYSQHSLTLLRMLYAYCVCVVTAYVTLYCFRYEINCFTLLQITATSFT